MGSLEPTFNFPPIGNVHLVLHWQVLMVVSRSVEMAYSKVCKQTLNIIRVQKSEHIALLPVSETAL